MSHEPLTPLLCNMNANKMGENDRYKMGENDRVINSTLILIATDG
jgi:hypothetical protein